MNERRGNRNNKAGKPERSGRPERFNKSDRPNKSERFEKPERPNKFQRPETPSKVLRNNEWTGIKEVPEEDFTYNDLDKLEGRNPVIEALKANRTINKILVAKGEREGSVKQIMALAREKKIVIQEVERSRLDSLSSTHAHQGVIAFVAAKDYVDIDDILAAAEAKGEAPFIILLDEISDAYNLGSILRTADAVGAHGVVIPKRRAVGLTTAVSKASAGAVEYVPVARVTNISQTIEYLKKKNVWVVGTDLSGDKAFFESDLKGPIALVVGSEGEGIGKLVAEKCDFIVNIPMKGQISSLNAAVAGAIVMYEVLKQRSK